MDSKLHDKGLPQKERYDLMKRLQVIMTLKWLQVIITLLRDWR